MIKVAAFYDRRRATATDYHHFSFSQVSSRSVVHIVYLTNTIGPNMPDAMPARYCAGPRPGRTFSKGYLPGLRHTLSRFDVSVTSDGMGQDFFLPSERGAVPPSGREGAFSLPRRQRHLHLPKKCESEWKKRSPWLVRYRSGFVLICFTVRPQVRRVAAAHSHKIEFRPVRLGFLGA